LGPDLRWRAIPPLLRLSEHNQAGVRARAALALGRVLTAAPDLDNEGQAALDHLAEDSNPAVTLAAEKALHNLSPRSSTR
jgi:vesicle coat complex subunit